MKEEFKLPFMVLHRGDLEDKFSREKINKISDEDMGKIAELMSKMFMQDWSMILENAIEKVVNNDM